MRFHEKCIQRVLGISEELENVLNSRRISKVSTKFEISRDDRKYWWNSRYCVWGLFGFLVFFPSFSKLSGVLNTGHSNRCQSHFFTEVDSLTVDSLPCVRVFLYYVQPETYCYFTFPLWLHTQSSADLWVCCAQYSTSTNSQCLPERVMKFWKF